MTPRFRPSDLRLSSIFRMVPDVTLSGELRSEVKTLFDELDQLLFLDDSDELSVDRGVLIRIANNETLVPVSIHDIAILETSKHLGRRLKALGRGRNILWREGENYGMPIHPASAADLRAWGLSKSMSIDELGEAMNAQFPELVKLMTSDEPKQLAEAALGNFMVNRTVWDCLVANLGFWAALTLIGSHIIFLTLLASVGWQVALFWAVVYSGAATAYFLGQCVLNPNFQQR